MERKSKRTMKIFVHSLFLFSYEASPRLYNKIEIDKGENKRIQKKAERKAKKVPLINIHMSKVFIKRV